MTQKVNLAAFIRKHRQACGLTQKQLAEKIHQLNPQYTYVDSSVAHWERVSDPAMPPLGEPDFVQALATALETEPIWIYHAAGWLKFDTPISNQYGRILSLMEKATPYQREIIEQVIYQQAGYQQHGADQRGAEQRIDRQDVWRPGHRISTYVPYGLKYSTNIFRSLAALSCVPNNGTHKPHSQ